MKHDVIGTLSHYGLLLYYKKKIFTQLYILNDPRKMEEMHILWLLLVYYI